MADPATDNSANKPVGHIAGYELLERIGRGGMGTVYRARQTSLDKIVAVKVLKPSLAKNETFVKRFLREAQSAGQLNHPNIVQAVDAGEAKGYYYFVMEYIEGRTLRQTVSQEGPLPEDRVLTIAEQIARALAHAWRRGGMIHRDIKPDNIMVLPDGSIKVMDMGLAKSTEDEDVTVTQAGRIIGSPSFASPEQLRGEVHDLDIRTDLYSLGCTLYFAATGQSPFGGPTAAVIMTRNLAEPLPKVREVRPELSEALEFIIARMAEKDREDRFDNPEEVLDAIRQLREGTLEVGPSVPPAASVSVGPRRRPDRPAAPNPWPVLVALAGVAMFGGVWAFLHFQDRAERGAVAASSSSITTTVPRASPAERLTTVRPAAESPKEPEKTETPEDRLLALGPPITRDALAELKKQVAAFRADESTLENAVSAQQALLESLWGTEARPRALKALTPRLQLLRRLLAEGFILEPVADRAQHDWVVYTWKSSPNEVRELVEQRRWVRETKLLTPGAVAALEKGFDRELERRLASLRRAVNELEEKGDYLAAFRAYEKVLSAGPNLFPETAREEIARLRVLAGLDPDARREAWTVWFERSRERCAARDYTSALRAFDAAAGQLKGLGPYGRQERSDLLEMAKLREAVKKGLERSIGEVLAIKGFRGKLKSVDGDELVQVIAGKDFKYSLKDLRAGEVLELASAYLAGQAQRERVSAAFLVYEDQLEDAQTWLRKAEAKGLDVAYLSDKATAFREWGLSRELLELLERARAAVGKQDWDAARAGLAKIDERFSSLSRSKELEQQLTDLRFAAATLGGSLEDLFHGEAKLLGGGAIELAYEFSKTTEFRDWGYLGPAPGALVCFSTCHTLAARFLLDDLEIECEALSVQSDGLMLRVVAEPDRGWAGELSSAGFRDGPALQSGQIGARGKLSEPLKETIWALRPMRGRLRVTSAGIEGGWGTETARVRTEPPRTGYVQIGMVGRKGQFVGVYDRIRIRGRLDLDWVAEEFRRRENRRRLVERMTRVSVRKNHALGIGADGSVRLPGHINGMKTGTIEMFLLLEEGVLGLTRSQELLGEHVPQGPVLGRLAIEPGTPFLSFSLFREKRAGGQVLGSVPIRLGEWHHLAACWDRKGARLYVDGVLCGENPEMTEGIPSADFRGLLVISQPWADKRGPKCQFWLDEIRLSSIARYDGDFGPSAYLKPDRQTVMLFHCDEGEGSKTANAMPPGTTAFLRSMEWLNVAQALSELAGRREERAKAEEDGTAVLPVPANRPWVETGILLQKGEQFSLQAEGRWQYGIGESCGPRGTLATHQGHPKHGLIGRVAPQEETFFVGASHLGQAKDTGLLQLMINDDEDGLWENEGKLTVRFSRGP